MYRSVPPRYDLLQSHLFLSSFVCVNKYRSSQFKTNRKEGENSRECAGNPHFSLIKLIKTKIKLKIAIRNNI